MGYYVNGNGELRIKAENLGKAYEALMALQDAPDKAKRGGSYSANERRYWFSWMPEDLRTLPDTKAVFAELGFEVDSDENGDLLIRCYDNKTGQEEVFFAAAAPFIEEGEYEWEGEDGEFWKWSFHDGKMFLLTGERSYNHAGIVEPLTLLEQERKMTEDIEATIASRQK
jgi:hypothetical protein